VGLAAGLRAAARAGAALAAGPDARGLPAATTAEPCWALSCES
jgi:hypothetical protein